MRDQRVFSGARYLIELAARDREQPTPATRELQREASRYGVDLLLIRVATSELFRDSPTAVRTRWAIRDYIAAHVVLDAQDRARAAAALEGSPLG